MHIHDSQCPFHIPKEYIHSEVKDQGLTQKSKKGILCIMKNVGIK